MSASPANLSKEAIVRLYKAGALLGEIAKRHGQESERFAAHCVALHNAGTIDLLSLTSGPAFAALATHPFFVVQHFFCNAIPNLSAVAGALMACCAALIDKAGSDGAAGLPNLAFQAWCRSHPRQGAAVIRGAQEGDPLSKRFLASALIAGGRPKAALDFARRFKDDRRLSGIYALGQIKHTNLRSAQTALAALQIVVANPSDDRARAEALRAAFGIIQHWPQLADASVTALVSTASVDAGLQTLYAITDILWLHQRRLDDAAVQAAFTALLKVDPTHTAILQHLDIGLGELIGTTHEGRAFEFLAAFLARPDITSFLSHSSTLGHRLTQDQTRLHRLLIQAFLTANLGLAKGLTDVLNVIEKPAPFSFDLAPFKLAPLQLRYLCRKAVGFLFLKPVVAASLLVAALRADNGESSGEIEDLLFDPLLVNFGGDPHDYLATISPADPVYPAAQMVLARESLYLEGLRAPGILKELHPSEARRAAQRQQMIEEGRAVHKMVQKESVFMNLVHRTVLLYGRKSLTFVPDRDSRFHGMEMELHAMSVSFEMARATIVDPVGVEYMLLVFRAESPPT